MRTRAEHPTPALGTPCRALHLALLPITPAITLVIGIIPKLADVELLLFSLGDLVSMHQG